MNVRPIRASDLPAVTAAWTALYADAARRDPAYAVAPGRVAAHARGWLVDKPFPAAFVAEVDGGFAGFVTVQLVDALPVFDAPVTAVIGDAWVDPARRGHGVGRALVETAMAAARAAGVGRVEVNTLAADDAARAFWAAVGFAPARITLAR